MEPAWWVDLEPPWRACLELAWEAFGAGSIPIGAVVVDQDGAIVARGRNRQRELIGPPPQVAGTNLAHAEVNALIQMPRGHYANHTLYSTLQPCLLCTGAICHTHIGHVRYATADPVFVGIDRLPELNAHVARQWPRWYGPDDNEVSLWSQLLTFVFAIRDDVTLLNGMQRRSAELFEAVTTLHGSAVALDVMRATAFGDVVCDEDAIALRDAYARLVRAWGPRPNNG